MTVLTKKSNKQLFLTLTMSELARETDIDIARWSRWLHGKQAPTTDTLERAAIALNMPVTELFDAFLERRSRTMQSKQLAKSA